MQTSIKVFKKYFNEKYNMGVKKDFIWREAKIKETEKRNLINKYKI